MRVERFGSMGELSRRAAELFIEAAKKAIDKRGAFYVALSGGATPRLMYETLGSDAMRGRVKWSKCSVFWGDERCVPPDHADSNYRMAREALLSKVSATAHRIKGELGAQAAADDYENVLGQAFGLGDGGNWPRFDLVLLGLGDDGHTASLFPGSPALGVKDRMTAAVTDTAIHRVTLTLPVLNKARSVVFMAGGEKKTPIIKSITEMGNPEGYPAGLVIPTKGSLTWLTAR